MVEAAGIGSLSAIHGLRDRPTSCRPPAQTWVSSEPPAAIKKATPGGMALLIGGGGGNRTRVRK